MNYLSITEEAIQIYSLGALILFMAEVFCRSAIMTVRAVQTAWKGMNN